MNFDFVSQNDFVASTSQGTPSPEVVGLILPGSHVKTKFVPVDNSGLKFALQLSYPGDFPGPLPSITEIVLFLLPTIPLPPDHGILCFWQISAILSPTPGIGPPSTGFELLGALSPARPSAVFPTKWSEHEQVLELCSTDQPLIVTIGVSLEPLSNIQNIGAIDPHQGRLFVAQRIASDLFKFMQSFDTGAAGASQMVVPNNIFDRWFHRFENRFRRDPNFFLRNEG